jgi:phosphoenolpyruvate synthase/pyruvate phosphate dikinase
VDEIKISPDFANEILIALNAVRNDENTDPATVERLSTLAESLDEAMIAESRRQSQHRTEQVMVAKMAKRFAKNAVANFEQVSASAAKALSAGTGLGDSQISQLMKAQAAYKQYLPVYVETADEDILGALRRQLDQARRTLSGGYNSTDSVTRAIIDHDRQAAARFVSDWEHQVG